MLITDDEITRSTTIAQLESNIAYYDYSKWDD